MIEAELAAVYGRYIDCLNRQDWANLGAFVRDDAVHNGRPLGLSGYRAMLEADFRAGRIAEVWSVLDKTAIEAQI